MTLLKNGPDDGQPGVHALVIGIGRYPRLVGGEKKPVFGNAQGMGQLSSPPVSAAAIASWLLKEHSISGCPLKSLDVLASGAAQFVDDTGQPVTPEAAEMEHVKAAIKAWKVRANAHAGNVMVLYFCGHGVSTGAENSLLMEDFGEDEDDPFSAAIDMVKLLTGMRRCQASRQVYLIDACRTVSEDYLKQYANSGVGIVDATAHTNLGAVQQAVVWSTTLGAQAFGLAGQPSLFASAMLKALQGAAGTIDDNGDWVVRPLSLKAGLDVVMQRLAPDVDQTVSLDQVSKNFAFHHLSSPPKVPAVVRCEPAHFMPRSRLVCTSTAGQVAERIPAAEELWDLELEVGDYEFQANVPPALALVGQMKVTVFPPGRKVSIRCT